MNKNGYSKGTARAWLTIGKLIRSEQFRTGGNTEGTSGWPIFSSKDGCAPFHSMAVHAAGRDVRVFSHHSRLAWCQRGSAMIEYVSIAGLLALGLLCVIAGSTEGPGLQQNVEDTFVRAAYGTDADGSAVYVVLGREIPRPSWCPGGVSNLDGGTCGTQYRSGYSSSGGGAGGGPGPDVQRARRRFGSP